MGCGLIVRVETPENVTYCTPEPEEKNGMDGGMDECSSESPPQLEHAAEDASLSSTPDSTEAVDNGGNTMVTMKQSMWRYRTESWLDSPGIEKGIQVYGIN